MKIAEPFRKGLAIIIILLFLCVALAPSINMHVVKASREKEFIKVTTEFCGFDQKPNSVNLTKQDAKKLEAILYEVKGDVEKAKTIDEVKKVFNEVIIKLDALKIFGNIPINHIQELVFNQTIQNRQITKKYTINEITDIQKTEEEINNKFCFVVGKSGGHTYILPNLNNICEILMLALMMASLLFFGLKESPLAILMFLLESTLDRYAGYLFHNKTMLIRKEFYFLPGDGWITTFGINGKQSIKGTFIGTIPRPFLDGLLGGPSGVGITKFNGIKIFLNAESEELFFLGQAKNVMVTKK